MGIPSTSGGGRQAIIGNGYGRSRDMKKIVIRDEPVDENGVSFP